MEKTSFELAPVPPYNFHLQWKFFHSPREPQPEIYCNGLWKRAFKLGNTLLPVTVASTGTVEKPKLTVTAFSQLNAEQKKALADKITDIFRLKENLSEVYAFMEKYETLRRIKKELYGLKPPGIGATIFEGIVRVILQQQISLKVAYVITGALVKKFGEKVQINSETFYDFPSPQKLAKADENELRKCKLSRQKARYVKEFASAVAQGYDLEKLKEMSNEDVIEELTKFNGVGIWTAELVLIAVLGRMEVCVPNDLGARKAVSHFYFGGKLQPGDVVRRFMERWGKFKGWVIYYLLCAYNLELLKDETKPF